MQTEQYSSWLEIDLTAISHNVSEIRRITGKRVMAVVKANGYGHGVVEAAEAAFTGGASWVAVARVEEALAIRHGGVRGPILVLGLTPAPQIAEAAALGISLAIFHPELAPVYSAAAMAAGVKLRVHAKIDTSMGRLGVFPEQGLDFLRQLNALPGLKVEGMFTHFSFADEPQRPDTAQHIQSFQTLVTAAEAAGLRPELVHAANSATTLYFPQAHFDMVRPGIAIYGLHPSSDAPLPETFRPALTWKGRISSIKMLPPNHGVGYNARYVTQAEERIGAVAMGYADGLRRRVGNVALVCGKRVKLAGGVCMDQCMLHLDEVPEARMGDEVVFVGRQGDAVLSAEEVAQGWGTVNYDVVCGLAARLPRLYIR